MSVTYSHKNYIIGQQFSFKLRNAPKLTGLVTVQLIEDIPNNASRLSYIVFVM